MGSVKTILHRGPNEAELPRKEIRRFEIEENAIGSYDYFRQKIVALYPDLTPESPFRLMWTDEEGDNVCFSSDEELRQAVKFIQSQENKLFKCNDGKATTSSSSSNVYPNLNENAMETNKTAEQHGYEDLTAEASEAKLNEAVSKMKELGFAGNWVKELLKNVDGDVAKAIEQLNPSK